MGCAACALIPRLLLRMRYLRTPIVEQQVVIAAGLLVVPIEEVRSEAQRILGEKTSHTTVQGGRRGSMSSVAVVRKTSRRFG